MKKNLKTFLFLPNYRQSPLSQKLIGERSNSLFIPRRRLGFKTRWRRSYKIWRLQCIFFCITLVIDCTFVFYYTLYLFFYYKLYLCFISIVLVFYINCTCVLYQLYLCFISIVLVFYINCTCVLYQLYFCFIYFYFCTFVLLYFLFCFCYKLYVRIVINWLVFYYKLNFLYKLCVCFVRN